MDAHSLPLTPSQQANLDAWRRDAQIPITLANASITAFPRPPCGATQEDKELSYSLDRRRENLVYFRDKLLRRDDMRAWLDSSVAAVEHFVETWPVREIRCKFCPSFSAVLRNPAEVARHGNEFVMESKRERGSEETRFKRDAGGNMILSVHGSNKKDALDKERQRQERMLKLSVQAVAAPSDGGDLRALARSVRAAQTMKLVSVGVPLNQIRNIFSLDMLKAAEFHTRYTQFGTAGTMSDDIQSSLQLCRERAVAEVGDKFGTIVIDGASSNHDGGVSAACVVFVSAELPAPIMLDVSVNRGGASDADYYVGIVRRFTNEVKIDISNFVVGLMGDNVTLNDTVAERLGLPRLKCIPHACALMCRAIYDELGVVPFLRSLHTVFTAGGSNSRRVEAATPMFASKGLDVHAILQFYPNRWYSADELLRALVANKGEMLDALRLFLSKSTSMAKFLEDIQRDELDADTDVFPSLDGIEAATSSTPSSASSSSSSSSAFAASGDSVPQMQRRLKVEVASKALQDLKSGLEDDAMRVKLAVSLEMTKSLQNSVRDCSSDSDNVSRAAVSSALLHETSFILMRDAPEMVRSGAATILHEFKAGGASNGVNADLRLKSTDWLDDAIKRAADGALQKTHHISEWSKILRHKIMYDPRITHSDADTFDGDEKEVANRTASTYGVSQAKWESDKFPIMSEYSKFATYVGNLPEAQRKALRPAHFWRSNAHIYPHTYNMGLWYASVQTSSVAAERCFGVMRATEAPNKRAQKDPAWRAEVYLRYNKWLVDRVWDDELKRVPQPTAGAGAAAAARFFGPPDRS